MSMNKYMHPRNIYKNPPNFKQLAFEFPEFKKYVKLDISGKVTLDFKDPDALRTLSRTLLKKDFALDVEIPPNKLVPTIPLRLNYILWIEDLLSVFRDTKTVKGIDIGTGASCVYPLMAAKKNQWQMLATETDKTSVEHAMKNIERNNLQHLITVVQVSGDTLLTEVVNPEVEYDFCMCNPPFFSSTQELHPFFKARKQNRPHPKNAFVASVNEVVAKGGEVEFIQLLIKESKILKTNVKIFTTMVGQKSDLPILKKLLRDIGVSSFKESEFCQGNTTRWGLAWTFLDYDLRKVAEKVDTSIKKHPPLLFEFSEYENSSENIGKVTDILLGMFKALQMTFEEVTRNKLHPRYFVTAHSNTWSNQRRKRREKLRKGSELATEEMEEQDNNNMKDKPTASVSIKRSLDELLCETTTKKLRLSTDSENSESTVFFKFMFALNCLDKKVILELNNVDDTGNRDYLHQILQYIKNNLPKEIKNK